MHQPFSAHDVTTTRIGHLYSYDWIFGNHMLVTEFFLDRECLERAIQAAKQLWPARCLPSLPCVLS